MTPSPTLNAPAPEPVVSLIDDDSDGFLRIRGVQQGRDLLDRALLSDDIEGVRFYLDAMAEKWPQDAANCIGAQLYAQDLAPLVNGNAPAFFTQVREVLQDFPAVDAAVFRAALPLSTAITRSDYATAELLTAQGFEVNPRVLTAVLLDNRATSDNLAWMQAASPEKFALALGAVAAETILNPSVAEDKLRFVLEAATDAVKLVLSQDRLTSQVLRHPGGVRTARALADHGMELNVALLREQPDLFSSVALIGCSAEEDAQFFATAISPALPAEGHLYRSDIINCETVAMLKAVLPHADENFQAMPARQRDAINHLAMHPQGLALAAYMKEAYALDVADALLEPAYSTDAGTTRVQWDKASLVVLKVFGPEAANAHYGAAEAMASMPVWVARELQQQLAREGIVVSPESADLHKVVAMQRHTGSQGWHSNSLVAERLAQHPEQMGERNAQGYTVIDAMLVYGTSLKCLPPRAQEFLSPEIDGQPPVHAYALSERVGSRLSDWEQTAAAYGFDLLARNDKGQTIAAVVTEGGFTEWFPAGEASTGPQALALLTAKDNQGNTLGHTLAQSPLQHEYSAARVIKAMALNAELPPSELNLDGKTAGVLLREGKNSHYSHLVGTATGLERDWANARKDGYVVAELTGLSQNGQRAHATFKLVQEAGATLTETDITVKVGEILKKENMDSARCASYEAKAKAVQWRNFQMVPGEQEAEAAFRLRAASRMAEQLQSTVAGLNGHRGLRERLQTFAKDKQQAVAAKLAAASEKVSTGRGV